MDEADTGGLGYVREADEGAVGTPGFGGRRGLDLGLFYRLGSSGAGSASKPLRRRTQPGRSATQSSRKARRIRASPGVSFSRLFSVTLPPASSPVVRFHPERRPGTRAAAIRRSPRARRHGPPPGCGCGAGSRHARPRCRRCGTVRAAAVSVGLLAVPQLAQDQAQVVVGGGVLGSRSRACSRRSWPAPRMRRACRACLRRAPACSLVEGAAQFVEHPVVAAEVESALSGLLEPGLRPGLRGSRWRSPDCRAPCRSGLRTRRGSKAGRAGRRRPPVPGLGLPRRGALPGSRTRARFSAPSARPRSSTSAKAASACRDSPFLPWRSRPMP